MVPVLSAVLGLYPLNAGLISYIKLLLSLWTLSWLLLSFYPLFLAGAPGHVQPAGGDRPEARPRRRVERLLPLPPRGLRVPRAGSGHPREGTVHM